MILGVHVRLDAARSSGKVTLEPKIETVQKICALSTHHLQLQSMTPAKASKLRGMAGRCASNTFGRVGRLGLAQLKRRQYSTDLKDFELDAPLMFGLQFLIFVLPFLAPRSSQIFGAAGRPTIVYSDASWPEWSEEPADVLEEPRLGWIVCRPGKEPLGNTLELREQFVRLLLPRKTQVFAAEAIVPFWFIDNEATVSSLLRGTSRAEDVGQCTSSACSWRSASGLSGSIANRTQLMD